jgi:hypothetical protein
VLQGTPQLRKHPVFLNSVTGSLRLLPKKNQEIMSLVKFVIFFTNKQFIKKNLIFPKKKTGNYVSC